MEMKPVITLLMFFFIMFFPLCFVYGNSQTAQPCVLQSIEYRVDGTTKDSALRALALVKEGDEFVSLEALIKVLDDQKQSLMNRRVFKSVEYELVPGSLTEGKQYYTAVFTIVDAVSFYAIPYPKYDSNTGLRLGVKNYWNNFLGTLTDLYLGMAVDFRKNSDTDKIETGQWYIHPAISGIRLPKGFFLSGYMDFSYNEKEFIDEVTPANSYDYSYYSAGTGANMSFPVFPKASYGVGLGMECNFNYRGNLGPNFQQPYSVELSHALSYGSVKWEQNFRRGFSVSVSNRYRMGGNGGFFFIPSVDVSARYYVPFWKRFNFYTRSYAFYQWNEPRNIASYIRGVRNNAMSGKGGFIFNASMAFQFWRFEKVWDAQVHPFVDVGLSYGNDSFDFRRDVNVGIGADFVLYLDVLPSLVAVGSVGIDPRSFDKSDIFNSLEITITSSLFF
ncbi:MAG: hypothetical protein CSA76_05220 [Spirochaetales bacterium]|nr:MAG: hypothetical protein CSA76_05220 [Spirochaetales bacterium]